jgi:excisionase family DNA binding protein
MKAKREEEERDRLLSCGDVARELGYSTSAVIVWCNTGRLPFSLSPGGHRRFRRADVDAFKLSLAPVRKIRGGDDAAAPG